MWRVICADCSGECNGDAILDECGVCNGPGAEENFDCDGNCLIDTDCNGVVVVYLSLMNVEYVKEIILHATIYL